MKLKWLTLLAGALALAFTPAASAADIVDTAIAGNFHTLVTAVKTAELVDTLKSPGPFTVFAPTVGIPPKVIADSEGNAVTIPG
jgi:Fasciclin domain